jgi:hypothetical protein
MGNLVIQKPAAFDVRRLRKDLNDCGWVFGQPKLMGLHLRWTASACSWPRAARQPGSRISNKPCRSACPGWTWRARPISTAQPTRWSRAWPGALPITCTPSHNQVGFWLFDVVSTADQSARIKDLIQIEPEPPLYRVHTWRLRSEDMVYDSLARWLAEGYEGIVLRHPLGRWKTGYSAALQKIKPGGEDTYRIVNACRATLANNLLTGLLVEGAGGHRFRVHASPELDRPDLAGKLARVRYTEIGKGGNPLSSAAIEILEAAA